MSLGNGNGRMEFHLLRRRSEDTTEWTFAQESVGRIPSKAGCRIDITFELAPPPRGTAWTSSKLLYDFQRHHWPANLHFSRWTVLLIVLSVICKFISKSLANREGLQTFIQKLRFLHFGISPSKLHLMGSEMGLLASAWNSDVDLALGRVEMSCVQKIILTKVDAGQVAMRKITNLHLCKVKEHDKGSLFWRFSLKKICKQQSQ